MHDFLSLNRPIITDAIVVEGWLFDYMLDAAIAEIKQGEYQLVITTGQEKSFKDRPPYEKFTNVADYCRARLIMRGIPPDIIHAISSPSASVHYTFNTASAIKPWLKNNGIKAVNVFTGGPHGRKSYRIFKKALGPEIEVGVISCDIKHYDSNHWWVSKRGLSVTLRYFIGYIYSLTWPFDLFPPN